MFLKFVVAVAIVALCGDAVPSVGQAGEGLVDVERAVELLGAGIAAHAAGGRSAVPSAGAVAVVRVGDSAGQVDGIVGRSVGKLVVGLGRGVGVVVGVVAQREQDEFEVVERCPVASAHLFLLHTEGERVVGDGDFDGVAVVVAGIEGQSGLQCAVRQVGSLCGGVFHAVGQVRLRSDVAERSRLVVGVEFGVELTGRCP